MNRTERMRDMGMRERDMRDREMDMRMGDYRRSRRDRAMNRTQRMRDSRSRRDYGMFDSAYDRAYDRTYDRNYDRAYDRNYDRNYDMPMDRRYSDRGYSAENQEQYDENYDYGDKPSREYYGAYGDTPFYVRETRDFARRDYGEMDTMSKQELMSLHKKLLNEVDSSEREMFSMEKVMKRAEELGMKFDKYSPESLAVATLMVYTDYCKTLGKGNLDMYIRLADDFLCDKDSKLKGDEKLTAYFDNVVMPE